MKDERRKTKDDLVVMQYEATERFRAITQHVAVAHPDGRLVAVTGPDGDAESAAYARLFAASPNLLAALKQIIYVAERRERPSNETYGLICELARDALARASGE